MILQDSISIKGTKDFNFDVIGQCENIYFVFDGATPMFDDNVFSQTSDLFEYMSRLKQNVKPASTLTRVMFNAIKNTTDYFGIANLEEVKSPSWTVAMIRVNKDNVEYYLFADAAIIIELNTGEIRILTDERFQPFEQEAKKKKQLTNDPESQFTINQTTRLLLNQENGYPIASIRPRSAVKGKTGTINIKDIREMILCSDGFRTIEFNQSINQRSIEEHINRIFEACSKKRDDISVIHLSNR